MDAFVVRFVALVAGKKWMTPPAAVHVLPQQLSPDVRLRVFLAPEEVAGLKASLDAAAAAEVELVTNQRKSVAADFVLVADARTGKVEFCLLRASPTRPDVRVLAAGAQLLREVLGLVFPVRAWLATPLLQRRHAALSARSCFPPLPAASPAASLAASLRAQVWDPPWQQPGGGDDAQTLIVVTARHKGRMLCLSAAVGAPVGLLLYDVCHVVEQATWLDHTPGGLRGVDAGATALLRASMTAVAGLVRTYSLRMSAESRDLIRYSRQACSSSADDAATFGDVFCARDATPMQFFDPAPFERGRAISTETYSVRDANGKDRCFALCVHPCNVVSGMQSAYDTLLVARMTAEAFADDAVARAVLGDLCDTELFADVASAYAVAEAASTPDSVSFLAAIGGRNAEAELGESLARALNGRSAPDALRTALFSMATATSSATETVLVHICDLMTVAWNARQVVAP